ncbi:MAG: hypothetical protein ABFD91_03800 [Anaerohalosphaeraceae bacterium]
MNFLKAPKESQLWRIKWHLMFAAALAVAFIFSILTFLFKRFDLPETADLFTKLCLIAIGFDVLIFLFALLLLIWESVQSSKENGIKLDNQAELIARNNNLLTQLNKASHLSDTAKEIAFQDIEQLELGEAALTKLHQHDFDATLSMIEAMEQSPRYKQLGTKLQKMTEKYRTSTEEGRVQQIIMHIEELIDQARWAQAATQIETLIKVFPYSEKAKTMNSHLRERKDMRKGELLCEWDKAVQAKDTELSLAILKELDQYLTPAEALALQESASSVFKTKLHNLGVQFTMAVTERNWISALETGKDIVQNFPNSRMAAEIRSKLDILQDRARKSLNLKTS